MLDRFIAGVVGTPHGVKGFVKVRVFSGETDHLENLSSVTLRSEGRERVVQIEAATGSSSAFLMKFRGTDTPEAAKLLTGAEIIVPREFAAPLGDDEYYIEDLRGISVILLGEDGTSESIGEVNDIIEGGGGQLVEVRLLDGTSRLVPFRGEFFGDIDLSARTVVLHGRWMLE